MPELEPGTYVWFQHRDQWLCGVVTATHSTGGRASCSVAVVDWRWPKDEPQQWLVPWDDLTVAQPPAEP